MRGIEPNGEQIRALRRKHGLTQDKLASHAGLDARTIRNAERGSRVDAETLKCLASALGVYASELARPGELGDADRAAVAIQQWEDAFFATDVDRLVSLYREDAVMQLPSSPVIEGIQAIRAAFEAAYESYRFERVTESILNVVGDRVFLPGSRAAEPHVYEIHVDIMIQQGEVDQVSEASYLLDLECVPSSGDDGAAVLYRCREFSVLEDGEPVTHICSCLTSPSA